MPTRKDVSATVRAGEIAFFQVGGRTDFQRTNNFSGTRHQAPYPRIERRGNRGSRKKSGVELPGIYRTFLAECGRSAGELFYDVHFTFAALIHLKQKLRALMEEEGTDFEFPDNAFVFNAYQGYQFHYFVCDQDDPPVFRVYDDGTVEPAAGSFSEYIREAIES